MIGSLSAETQNANIDIPSLKALLWSGKPGNSGEYVAMGMILFSQKLKNQ